MDRRSFVLGSLAAAGPAAASEPEDKDPAFSSGGRSIPVEWFPPSGVKDGEKAPAILLLHGAEGLAFAEGYRVAARLTAARGIGVAFVHYFARTGTKTVSLDGIRRLIPPWAQTVRDALTWLGGRPGVDPDRLGIVGVSLGAGLAFFVASRGETRIKAIVDFFGPISVGILPKAPKLPPVLILHGASDEIVPIIHARTLEAMLKQAGTPYEIKIYPAQGHGFVGFARQDAARRSAAFLDKYLAGKPPAG